jgi:hypothetical protein
MPQAPNPHMGRPDIRRLFLVLSLTAMWRPGRAVPADAALAPATNTRTPRCRRTGELETASTRQLAFPPFALAEFEPFDSQRAL